MGKFKDNFDFCFVLNNGVVQYMCLGEEKEESKEGGQIATREIFQVDEERKDRIAGQRFV